MESLNAKLLEFKKMERSFNELMIPAAVSSLTIRTNTAPGPESPETLRIPYARRCEGIFRPAQFPCDTFTAKDLKSDNVYKLQSAEESDSNTWSHRRDRPINGKTSSECSPLYNPTTYFMANTPLLR